VYPLQGKFCFVILPCTPTLTLKTSSKFGTHTRAFTASKYMRTATA